MGGQACVFYGAAEFSRDCDIVLLADDKNLQLLAAAVGELQADCIAVPPFELNYLERGHAIHFRCKHPDAQGIRLDVMTRMRGCDGFEQLWQRRTTITDTDDFVYEIIGIEDLVRAKKTQRDKDWPMIRRLVDAHYDQFNSEPTIERIRFWLRESRTPEILIPLAAQYPAEAQELLANRKLLLNAMNAEQIALQQALTDEEAAEKAADKAYWRPLKQELEELRVKRRHNARF